MSKHYRVTQLYVPDGTPLEPYLAMLGRELAPGEKAVIWRAPRLRVTVEIEEDATLQDVVDMPDPLEQFGGVDAPSWWFPGCAEPQDLLDRW